MGACAGCAACRVRNRRGASRAPGLLSAPAAIFSGRGACVAVPVTSGAATRLGDVELGWSSRRAARACADRARAGARRCTARRSLSSRATRCWRWRLSTSRGKRAASPQTASSACEPAHQPRHCSLRRMQACLRRHCDFRLYALCVEGHLDVPDPLRNNNALGVSGSTSGEGWYMYAVVWACC